MKKQLFLFFSLTCLFFCCKDDEVCQTERSVNSFTKNYIEARDSSGYKGQNTLILRTTNTQYVQVGKDCIRSKGGDRCEGDGTVQNLTSKKVTIYIARSKSDLSQNNFITSVNIAPNTSTSFSPNGFIVLNSCVNLDEVVERMKVVYE